MDEITNQHKTLKYTKSIELYHMVQIYHDNMGIIDQHNRKRQRDLAFHHHWPTRN